MNNKRFEKYDFVNGSIVKNLFKLAFLIMASNIFQTLYQIVDLYWVGKLGNDSLAALTLSFPIIIFVYSLGFGLSTASSILISHKKGINDEKNMNKIFMNSLLLNLFAGIFMTFFSLFLLKLFLQILNLSQSVFNKTLTYTGIYLLGTAFVYLYLTIQMSLRGLGEVKLPLIISIASLILNFFLDPIFIFGYKFIPAYGVKGAAITTFMTMFLSLIILIISIKIKNYLIKFNFKKSYVDLKLMKKIFKLGFPASLEFSLTSFGFLIMSYLVSLFGTVIIATFGVGIRILSFITMPMNGFAMATSTIIGQNFGAKKFGRVRETIKTSSLIVSVTFLFIAILVFIFAKEIVSIFVKDSETLKDTILFIKILSVGFLFNGLFLLNKGIFRSLGNTKTPFILTFLNLLILRIPLAFLLIYLIKLGYLGIWLSIPLSSTILFIVSSIYLRIYLAKNKIVFTE